MGVSIIFRMNHREILQDILIGLCGGSAAVLMLVSLKEWLARSREKRDMQRMGLLNVSEFDRIQKKAGEAYSIIFKPICLPLLKKGELDYMSNHKLFSYPSQRVIRQTKALSFDIKSNQTQWKAGDLWDRSTTKLYGVGCVLPEALDVRMSAIQSQSKPAWYKRIYKTFSAFCEGLLGLLLFPLFKTKREFVVLEGIKVGHFDVNYNWASGHMVAEVRIDEKGEAVVQTLGKYFPSLMEAKQNQIKGSFIMFLLFSSLMAYWVVYQLYPKIKTRTQARKAMKAKRAMQQLLQTQKEFQRRQLNFEPQNDQQTCAICMVENKNVIFKSCLHFIQCSSCLPEVDHQLCPICKTQNQVLRVFSTT